MFPRVEVSTPSETKQQEGRKSPGSDGPRVGRRTRVPGQAAAASPFYCENKASLERLLLHGSFMVRSKKEC